MNQPNQNELGRIQNAVNTYSAPSDLRITDIRVATVGWAGYPLIRIDTNQGVYGLGEGRDGGHEENILQFKAMLLDKNPCNVELIYHAIKRFGNWGREGGGVSGIEIALWDLVGRVYGVPCYQFLGGKFRDRVLVYGDTPTPKNPTPEDYVKKVLERKALGLRFIKFDVGLDLLCGQEGALCGRVNYDANSMFYGFCAPGTGMGTAVTDKGLGLMRDIIAAIREAVGPEVGLCIDHFGHGSMTAKEVIRFAEMLEPYGLAWMEDPMQWWDIEGHKKVTDATKVPIAAGEELYLWEGFRPWIERRAVDIIHPDMLTSGGLVETKKISEHAERYGIPTALHFAGSPIAFMANVHLAAAIPSLISLEHHGLDSRFWKDLVTGLPEPYIEGDGCTPVPDKPGLGLELNEEVIKEHLRQGSGLFDPTDQWNTPKLGWWNTPVGDWWKYNRLGEWQPNQ